MSPQADYVVSNGTGAAVRSDINGQLAAIVSNNSGASAPATTYAYMLWADTSTNLLKLRNGANSAWITVGDLTAANLGLATLASPTFTGTATIPTLTVSTAANIPLGSAASPTLYFTGDSNTGLYSPGADQVALSTGGTGRLFIDSSGRCGIGSSTPGAILDVAPDANRNLQVQGKSGTTYGLELKNGTANSGGEFHVTAASSGAVVINRGTTEIARFNSTGLGIGTASAQQLLHVNGSNATLLITGTTNTSGFQVGVREDGQDVQLLSNGSGGAMRFYTNPSAGVQERARIDSSGRLLVGTSSSSGSGTLLETGSSSASSANLAIDKTNSGTANQDGQNLFFYNYGPSATGRNDGTSIGSIRFYASQPSSGAAQEAAGIYCSADGNQSGVYVPSRLIFTTGGTSSTSAVERMRITSTGRMILTDTDTAASSATARIFKNAASTQSIPALMLDKYDNTSTTSQVFVQFTINNQSAASGQINANGASQAAFGSWSDARLKENIVDLPSQWSAIKTLRPVEFDYIESEGGGHQIGFVAQEVQEVYPDVVGERGDGMLTLSGMGKNESRLIKALQEAMERIEQLEAKVSVLESKP